MKSFKDLTCVLILLSCGVLVSGASAQEATSTRYLKGQSLQPAFEGWEQNPDGTYSMWFGYLNRNWEQALKIPVGPDNNIQPGGPDRGQPTYFQTGDVKRRQYFAFKVVVPADWPKDRDLVWTVTANGKTLKTIGTLWPVWLINGDVISANRGALRDTDATTVNDPPRIKESPKNLTVGVGAPLSMTMTVTDDGMPKRREPGAVPGRDNGPGRPELTGGAARPEPRLKESLRVTWLQWRGPGTATFAPDVARVVDENGRQSDTEGTATTTVTFDKPGTYLIRGYAEDTSLFSLSELIAVTVTDAPKTK